MKYKLRAMKKLFLEFINEQIETNKDPFVDNYLSAVKRNLVSELNNRGMSKKIIYRDYDLAVFNILKDVGLSPNQARVYAFMLANDSMKASPLIDLGIPRTECYHILKSLREKNLIGFAEDKFRIYYVMNKSNPLKGYVDIKRVHLQQVINAHAKLKELLK